MFSHVMIGSNDLERSRRFYDALFTAIGGKPARTDASGRLVYVHKGAALMITKPIDCNAATGANGGTIGFTVDGPAEADAWHAAGAENGGSAVEDPPGIRGGSAGQLYLAYLRDPDGNKLCALHRMPQ